MSQELPMLFTPEQVARMLSISRSTVYALLRNGQVRSVQIGRSRRFTNSQVSEFINNLEQLQTSYQITR